MMNPIKIIISVLSATLLICAANGDNWSIKGEQFETCCCDAPCPCNFGGAPTHGHCEANVVYKIDKARYNGIKLDGIKVASSFRVGEWIKFTVSEGASEKQMQAGKDLVTAVMRTMMSDIDDWEMLGVNKGAITIERSNNRVSYSTPDSTTEIEMIPGKNGGPITIANMAAPWLEDMVQYKSVNGKFSGGKRSFDFSGTNASASKVNAKGEI